MENKIFSGKAILIVLSVFMALQSVTGQSKFFLNPGVFYNGAGFSDDVEGLGVIVGVEYMKREEAVFSIELRTKYGYYSFDDGTSWSKDNDGGYLPPTNRGEARLKYKLFSPQVGVAPKLHLRFEEAYSFFLENEIVGGLMSGKFNYKGLREEKKFTEFTGCYNISIGAEYKWDKCTLSGSIGYSTLNFRSRIKKHQPSTYQEHIPDQNAALLVHILFKIPL